jgi:hypothetical protein
MSLHIMGAYTNCEETFADVAGYKDASANRDGIGTGPCGSTTYFWYRTPVGQYLDEVLVMGAHFRTNSRFRPGGNGHSLHWEPPRAGAATEWRASVQDTRAVSCPVSEGGISSK